MKTTFGLTLLALLTGGTLLGASTNPPAPAASPPPAPAEPPGPLAPGRAIVAGNNVNVRAQPTIYSEVLKRLNAGETVTVIESLTRTNTRPDDLAQWAKIAIPPEVRLWVHADYVDPTNKTVRATRLNLRAGPGENFSVVGTLERGAPIKEISTKGDWIEIEAPADAWAFVAAKYLKQETTVAAAPPSATGPPATPAQP
ncbi:MAG: SH3 domain-containing protein, partial [Verrucomicrobiales bacterium]|nr:SH3 domain-containing protein [Verrucomicrobiales bacterium]